MSYVRTGILPLIVMLSACTTDQLADAAGQLAKQGAAKASASPSASASPAAAAAKTGASAEALAAPYGVGRVYVYDTTLSGSKAECTIEITGADDSNLTLKVTNRYGLTVDAKTHTVPKAGGYLGYPFAGLIFNSNSDYARTSGGGGTRTYAPESVTVPAGTFATTRVHVESATNPKTIADSWVSEKHGLIKQAIRYDSADAAPMTAIELKSLN
jgi:hypothetical protein